MFTSRKPHRALPIAAVALAAATGLSACGGSDAGASGKAEVVASFYPMAWLATEVGGADATVQTLTKPGAEPHDLELTPRQIADVGKADLAVYVKGMQPAVDQAVAQHAKDKALDATGVVKTVPAPEGDGAEHGHEGEGGHEGEDGHGGENPDPHVWLDPRRTAAIATAVGARLADADADHAAAYNSRAAALAKKLTALDRSFETALKTCERRTIVTAHAAFGYLADRYRLDQVSIAGIEPGSEPSPKRLAQLTHRVKEAGATTVFTETLVSPKVAQALARSAGVKTAVLDPVAGIKEGSSGDYISIMKKNLATLTSALGCK